MGGWVDGWMDERREGEGHTEASRIIFCFSLWETAANRAVVADAEQ